MKSLATPRPADNSAAAIRTSIQAIREARAAADERPAELRIQRQELLLMGTAKAILLVDTEQRAVEITVNQLDTLLPLIEQELPAAEAREELAALEQMPAEALARLHASQA